jgi:SNF2 family DNA or RNA helicase
VRVLSGDVIHEIPRDPHAEQTFKARLDQVIAGLDNDDAAWLTFMLETVPALRAEGWEVVVEDGFSYRLVAADDWYVQMDTDAQRDWFDLRLGVAVDGRPVNLLPALVDYLQSAFDHGDASCRRIGEQLLIRLDDGRYLPIPLERMRRIADSLVELFEHDALNKQRALSLPVAQASRLAQLTRELQVPALRSNDADFLAAIEDLKNFPGIEPLAAPAGFEATLRPYQQEGLAWLQFLRRYRFGGILADDMGLGKTVQTLAHLALERQQGRLNRPALIVAPVSVIGNWQKEIRRFAPELRLLVLHGSKRRELFASMDRADVVVTGYPQLQLDSEALLAREFSFLILDEAQTIKNPRAKVSQVARTLRAERRLCLTGTPMENHLGELWSLFDFLQPGLLGDERQFQHQYRGPIEKNGDSRRAQALTRRIAPFILRRTKDTVAKDLPAKTQIVESIVLDEQQRDFYDGIRLAMHQRVRDAIQQQGLARSQITVLDALLKLRQACCDPRLTGAVDASTVPSAKMEWLLTVLPELAQEGRRILLFSQFTSMLELIEAAVTELGIPYLVLTGSTRDRTPLVERFQAGAVPLFLISLKAGGTGLNLTAADTVIHFDPWWNPAAEAQATDRAHRIGQDKPVFVYKLIAQNTVEERIMRLQEAKQALANQLYTEANAAPLQLSAADLESLFAP